MLITGSRSSTSVMAGRGDSLSINVSTRSAGSWRLEVWALVDGLEGWLGRVAHNSAGSLVVAVATVPGASGWRVDVHGPDGEVAEVTASPSPYPLGEPGLFTLDRLRP